MRQTLEAWRASLDETVTYQRASLGPAALATRITDGVNRHRERFKKTERLQRANQVLEVELNAVIDPPSKASGENLLARLPLIGRWFTPDSPVRPPLSEDIWARYEQALTHLRNLSHHIELMERDLVIMDQQARANHQGTLTATADRAVARHRVQTLKKLAIDIGAAKENPLLSDTTQIKLQGLTIEVEAQSWRAQLDAERFAAAIEADTHLNQLQQDLRPHMVALHAQLSALHQRERITLTAFTPKLGALAAEAAVKDLAQETGTSIYALRQTLADVCGLAHDNAIFIASHLDQVDQRMAALDEDCAQRRRALEEVERSLSPGGE
jgi:hypothetical protein